MLWTAGISQFLLDETAETVGLLEWTENERLILDRATGKTGEFKLDAYPWLRELYELDQQAIKRMIVRKGAQLGISEYLERDEPHYLLMTSQQVFAACVRKMRKIEDVSESTFDALRIKLRFTPMESKEVPASSAEIPKGSNLVISLADKNKIKGEVSAQEPRHLVATIDQENDMPPTGTQLTVYFHNDSGIFSFQSEIDRRSDRNVFIKHTDVIKTHQRRQFSRRNVPISIMIKSLNSEQEYFPSKLIDLSGGGASTQNPDKRFKAHQPLLVYFAFAEEKFAVTARVVRVSGNGTVLHVQFDSINEETRDRLISALF